MKRIVLLVLVPAILAGFGCATRRPPVRDLKRLPTLEEVITTVQRDITHEFLSRSESEFMNNLIGAMEAIYNPKLTAKGMMLKYLNSNEVQSLFAQRLEMYYKGLGQEESMSFAQKVARHYSGEVKLMTEAEAQNFADPFLTFLED